MAKARKSVIDTPRPYQTELFERALKENTIAVLDTGSGKTLIAAMLLRRIIDHELQHRADGKAPRISFFLVASVTLVYQQHAVLDIELDHKIARVCGADNTDNWNKKKWMQLLNDHKVIVATADILHQCLAHSYITMPQINLLIFDEAHHTKKNHAYARIVKDFYIDEPEESRPRIFGMTASPIDAKTDVTQAASELESLLHCRIATSTHMSLAEAVKRPAEHILRYAPLPHQPFETDFLRAIRLRFFDVNIFDKVYESAREIGRQLGRWCADAYVANTISEANLQKYEHMLRRRYYSRSATETDQDISQLDTEMERLQELIGFVKVTQASHLGQESMDLSSKIRELHKFLGKHFERPSEHRCIVFVQTRHTARLLNAVFQNIGPPHMHCGFLIGANNPEMDEDNFSFRQQVLTLLKFRKGDINCLFATSVAEEGLDVPDCNLIVRFDMYTTMIQYVQSRGRARQKNSKFIHMIEMGNSFHAELIKSIRFQEASMRRFCQALPEDRRLTGNEDDLEVLMEKEKVMRVYIEPSTKAKLTYGNALAYLANFVSAIPTGVADEMHPTYIVINKGSKFQATVSLPGVAPITSATGRVCTRRTLDRRSAAFEACLELRAKRYMNEHLMPTYQKRLPAMRNALLAVNMDKSNTYPMRTKPSIWAETRGSLPTELYMTVIDFPDGLEREHRPMAFLTRTVMPQFPNFAVFLNDRRASTVVSRMVQDVIHVSEDQLARLSAFTFRVFKDVFSKTYEEDSPSLSYWLAPMRSFTGPHDGNDSPLSIAESRNNDTSSDILDWSLLDEIFAYDEYTWKPDTPPESLVGRFLVDRWDGGRKCYSIAIAEHLRPQDPVPENSAKAKWEANILDYSISLYKNARAKATWDPNQPVIQAEKILARRNMLAIPNEKEIALRTQAFLCPEPLRISVLPSAVAATCFVWPAIIHRLEAYLIALEACAHVGVVCEPRMALAAVTKDSDNSGEHDNGTERLNFRDGMGENYERLEFIGDTFLKTATTISTFIQNPNANEFEFHVKRMLMLCNQNLFDVALELKTYEYIRSTAFSRRLWYPEGLTLLVGKGAGTLKEESIKHGLGEKTIADVSEAMIGAAFMTHHKLDSWQPSDWKDAVKAVTKLVGSADHTMMEWADYVTAYDIPAYQIGEVSASQKDLAEKVELEHAYHFNYPKLVRSAFIHPSEPLHYEKVPNYERLEFLGDALLDMASITHLFFRFPDKDPQWLTEHKMAMVSNKFLGAVCVNMGFHRHLRHSNGMLRHQIQEYVTDLTEAKRVAGDARDYWTTVSDPPKCLPDIVEAFIGAMFIDSNFNYGEVLRFFDEHIKWFFEDMSLYDSFANNHPCTHLHNLLQTTYGCMDYRLMARELPSIGDSEKKDVVAVVMVHNEVVAYSKGKSGRYARLRAANLALDVVKGLAPYEFRAKFACDCSFKVGENSAQRVEALTAQMGDCNI